ncbi:hypothetical protein BC332_16391 [Capsicum chinense]|nr:hypothetical protein BC332_16391 [Capsicum chinense]
MEEIEVFANEEGLHRAIVIKLSSGASDLKDLRTLLPKHFGIKGHCLIGSLAPRKLLISDTLSPKSFENLQKDDIFEESEDEDMLEICFASAARDVDISPGHHRNRKIKIYHDRNRSWDDKVTEEFVPRDHWQSKIMRHCQQLLRIPNKFKKF